MTLENQPAAVDAAQSFTDATLSPQQRVMAAADALFAETGRAPSVSAVRKRAGVGMPHAHEAMQAWRAAHQASQSAAVADEAALEMPGVVQGAFAAAWRAAVDAAQRDLVVLKADYEQQVTKLREEHAADREALQAEMQEMAGDVEAAENKSAQSQAELEELRGKNAELSQQLAAAVARYETADKALRDMQETFKEMARSMEKPEPAGKPAFGEEPVPDGKPASDLAQSEEDNDIPF